MRRRSSGPSWPATSAPASASWRWRRASTPGGVYAGPRSPSGPTRPRTSCGPGWPTRAPTCSSTTWPAGCGEPTPQAGRADLRREARARPTSSRLVGAAGRRSTGWCGSAGRGRPTTASRLKVWRDVASTPPGRDAVEVPAGDGRLWLVEVQPEGRRRHDGRGVGQRPGRRRRRGGAGPGPVSGRSATSRRRRSGPARPARSGPGGGARRPRPHRRRGRLRQPRPAGRARPVAASTRRDRRFVTELVYGTTRMRRACDFLVDRFLARPLGADGPATPCASAPTSSAFAEVPAARRGGRDGRRSRPGRRGAWSTPCCARWPTAPARSTGRTTPPG